MTYSNLPDKSVHGPAPRDDARRREAEMLAEGIAQLESGLGLQGPALDEWLAAWEAGGDFRSRRAPSAS